MTARRRAPGSRSTRSSTSITRPAHRRYGWLPDLPDHRDHLYSAPLAALGPLPPAVDLRRTCPAVYDQGALGSCTANAIAGALQFDQLKQALPEVFVPSRLFIYYNERAIEGTTGNDAGAMIRDGIKSVARQGAPPEDAWPYVIARFRSKPPADAYRDALDHQALIYQRIVRSLDQMKGCLAAGYPFVFGFAVYESFESTVVSRTGVAPMPGPGDRLLGGHAVLCVGYDDESGRFLARNSWGPRWGRDGYFTLPYAYLLDTGLADDFWTIKKVEG